MVLAEWLPRDDLKHDGDKSYPKGEPRFPFTGTLDKVRFDFGDSIDLTPHEQIVQLVKMV
jgi:hypothetical protein